MNGPDGTSCVESLENMFDLLYAAGYRLTGNHREAAGLVEGIIGTVIEEGGFYAALQGLYREYMKNSSQTGAGVKSGARSRAGFNAADEHNVQEALLYLPPAERMAVVLRDVLGLTCADIAGVTGLDEPAVARLLAGGRRFLRDLLIPRE